MSSLVDPSCLALSSKIHLGWIEEVAFLFHKDAPQIQKFLSSTQFVPRLLSLVKGGLPWLLQIGAIGSQFLKGDHRPPRFHPILQPLHILVVEQMGLVELILGLECGFPEYFLADVKAIVVELYIDLSVRVNSRLPFLHQVLKLQIDGIASFFHPLVVEISHRLLRLVHFLEVVDLSQPYVQFIVFPSHSFIAAVGHRLVPLVVERFQLVSVAMVILVPIPGSALQEVVVNEAFLYQFLLGRVGQGYSDVGLIAFVRLRPGYTFISLFLRLYFHHLKSIKSG